MLCLNFQPLLSHIHSYIDELECYSFSHIYREVNLEADKWSKEALTLDVGAFISQEFF
jgi:hypothetical protein